MPVSKQNKLNGHTNYIFPDICYSYLLTVNILQNFLFHFLLILKLLFSTLFHFRDIVTRLNLKIFIFASFSRVFLVQFVLIASPSCFFVFCLLLYSLFYCCTAKTGPLLFSLVILCLIPFNMWSDIM